MSEFTAASFMPGLAARHDPAAAALVEARPLAGFAAIDLRDRASGRTPAPRAASDVSSASAPAAASFVAQPAGPRHFSPADPDNKPTEGWDPLDPNDTGTPLIDPLAAAHAAGYAEGLAAAAVAAGEAGERDRSLLNGLLDQLGADTRIDRDRVACQLRQTVLALVGKLVGEIGISADLLAHRVEAAAKLLADSAESALLRVHPDDVALLAERLPTTIFPVGDASLTRGSFVLESASTLVEDGPELWLDQLAEAIEAAPMPASTAVPVPAETAAC